MTFKKSYTYADISLVPRTISAIEHRDDVDPSTNFCGVKIRTPLIISPMKTICGQAMCKELNRLGYFSWVPRMPDHQKAIDMYQDLVNTVSRPELIGAAVGATGNYLQNLTSLYEMGCKIFCIDVANGFSSIVVDAAIEVKSHLPDVKLVTGCVASAEGYLFLTMGSLIDVVRVGVGSGCFVAGTEILMDDGSCKKIEEVLPGEKVLTHKNRSRTVLNTMSRLERKELIQINNIECTPNHEIYVVNKKEIEGISITEANICEYARWVRAKDLTADYLLVEI